MLNRLFSFKGRIGRLEYFLTMFCLGIISLPFSYAGESSSDSILSLLIVLGISILITWISLAQGAKRCHDMGLNGFWQLIPLFPFVMIFRKGEEKDNQYGKTLVHTPRESQKDSKAITRAQWTKFVIITLLYLAFLVWVRSWWGLIVVPFIFDIYITKKIPWSFWKKSENPAVRSVMSWVDAIVFALVAVYFVNIYIFQNYQIPSSSLEKSLLVGDFLYVSKMSYGPRVPNTPLSMPLAQHTLPIVNTKSYIEWPQWKYKRVPGFGKVKLNDIVVFNFPAGDTVAVNYQQTTDFYTLAYNEGQRVYPKRVIMDSLTRAQQRAIYDLYYAAGRQQILNDKRTFGEVLWRPVDRRENYVKRCVGLPGDTLQIVDGQVMIDGKAIENPENLQFNYFVQTTGPYIPEDMLRELGISKDDTMLLEEGGWESGLLEMGLDSRNAQGKLNPVYHFPLTKKMLETLSDNKKLISKIVMEPEEYAGQMYPLNLYTNWNRNNYGPIWIPAKGETITLTEDNLPIYERCIVAYEGNKLEVKTDGSIYINGEKTDKYTFNMDYYWMMGDNRHNSADSRYWGFVPEDHVVGKPIVVWLSLDKDRGWFDGKIRWNRLFKWVD